MRSIIGRFRRPATPDPARIPPGRRVYAIGDVHGRLDLLSALLATIRADDAARAPAATEVVLLGDLIDRGPHSAQVIEYLLHHRPGFATFRFMMGNHETAMLGSMEEAGGDPHRIGWLAFGGEATLASYDVPDEALALPGLALAQVMRAHVPPDHRAFIAGFADHLTIGDYLFVHAGIRPGVRLSRQRREDLHWIRQEFLDDPRPHGLIVVHGHTISESPEFRDNRIGLDTGAYRTGVLTALGLEGGERWVLGTGEKADAAA
ncbi:metallophosphoesterase [Sphingomonas solaris]|uniref:Serine/threonine protein phosphatase n=1 Tax=Alterirhizorhabdus solaris TaxID=2529389 RepID=A0A558QT80_9SPHN|nr:metallophosphoesterase [Sphingomonas solaris]TVV70324.1 serine/threonine protein phosphatase [Sphingomonas solaris]